MFQVCKLDDGVTLSEAELESHNTSIKVQAREKLKEIPRMQILEHEFECLEQLDVLMEQKYEDLKEITKRQNQNLLLQELAKKAASTKEIVKSIATGVGVTIGAVAMALSAFILRK